MAYTDLPLKLPLFFGIGTGIFDVILFLCLIIADYFIVDKDYRFGYLSCLVILLFAILSVFVGIAGIYIGKIHTQVKERPIYIAKEILTYEENP